MALASKKNCPDCGIDLPADAPDGFCPKCLFARAGATLSTHFGKTQINAYPPESAGADDTPGASKPARSFNDYELIEEIARGGMGIVYRARQISLDRIVAVKMILTGAATSREAIHRFRTEAAAAANLQHPNIVAVHEVGTHRDENYLVMDFVDGPNLSHLVGQQPLPAMRAAHYVKLMAEAIQFAHDRGILHRDLKPSNVLIDSATDQPRVTDFGLAKRFHEESAHPNAPSDLTLTGQVLGSPNFMAPEQATGVKGRISRRTDVYGLGAILYHALTARPPFQAESLPETLQQVTQTEPPPLRLLNPNVPRDLETICFKCLEKEPAHRYASAGELAQELGRFLRDEPIHARPLMRVERIWRWCRRKPALAAACSLLILLLLLILIGGPFAAYHINEARQRAETEAFARREQLYAAEVNLAMEALAEANLSRARQLLDRQRPLRGETNDLRGFEWRFAYGQCRGDELVTLSRFTGPLTALRFSPNGQWLAVTDGKSNVKVLDHRSRKETAAFQAFTNVTPSVHITERKALAVSPDGRSLAVGVGNVIALWDVSSRHLTEKLFAHTDTISHLLFSPDGQTLASASADGTTRLWNLATRRPEPVAELPLKLGLRAAPYGSADDPPTRSTEDKKYRAIYLAYSDDSSLLAVSVSHSIISLWNVSNPADPRPLRPLKGLTGWAYAIAFAPGTHRLAAGVGSEIMVWDLDAKGDATSTNKLKESRGSLGVIGALAFSADGQRLVSAGSDRNLTLWDLTGSRREPVKLKGHEGEVHSVAFSPDDNLIASASQDGAVKLWDVASAWPASRQMVQGDWVYAVAFSPDSKLLASVGQNDMLKLWDVATERLVAELPVVERGTRLAFSQDGSLLAMDGAGLVRLIEVPSLVEVTNFAGTLIAFAPVSTELVYLHQGFIHFRHLKTHAEKVWATGLNSVTGRALSLDGQRIAIADSAENGVYAWNRGATIWPMMLGKHGDRVHSLAFSPDGQWLASASWDGTNCLWNLADTLNSRGVTHWPVKSLAAHNGQAWAVAFSPDGRTLASGGDDRTIRLWPLDSLQQAASLRGHFGAIVTLAFSNDGKHLASGSGDGTVRLWHAPAFEELESRQNSEVNP
ncbi:MAG: serine/threonine-protein kinase [Verrucomicrobiota bacterium]